MQPLGIQAILDGPTREITTPAGVTYRLPFQNICCRASVRVVDFFPSKLVDFAVPCKESEYDVLSDCGGSDDGSQSDLEENKRDWDRGHGWGGQETRWEWRFCLLLEDSTASKKTSTAGENTRLQVLVAEEDAVMLLRMDAEKYVPISALTTSVVLIGNVSLRTNPTALATLREKLFILWGDLEERKSKVLDLSVSALKHGDANKGPSSSKAAAVDMEPAAKPFECCLQEYGVKVGRATKMVGRCDTVQSAVDAAGWERRFRMFGTVIM